MKSGTIILSVVIILVAIVVAANQLAPAPHAAVAQNMSPTATPETIPVQVVPLNEKGIPLLPEERFAIEQENLIKEIQSKFDMDSILSGRIQITRWHGDVGPNGSYDIMYLQCDIPYSPDGIGIDEMEFASSICQRGLQMINNSQWASKRLREASFDEVRTKITGTAFGGRKMEGSDAYHMYPTEPVKLLPEPKEPYGEHAGKDGCEKVSAPTTVCPSSPLP